MQGRALVAPVMGLADSARLGRDCWARKALRGRKARRLRMPAKAGSLAVTAVEEVSAEPLAAEVLAGAADLAEEEAEDSVEEAVAVVEEEDAGTSAVSIPASLMV